MKQQIAFALVLCIICLTCPLPGYAYEFKPNSFCIGLMAMNYDYDEKVQEPLKSTEEGTIPGIVLSYTYKNPKELYFDMRVERVWGQTDYDGSQQDGTPVQGKTDNTFMTYEASIGWTFVPRDFLIFAPYIGYGYNTWTRELGGELPYDETYNFSYVPLGFFMSYDVTKNINVGLNAAFIHMLKAEMDIDASGYSSETADLKERDGYRVEVPLTFQFAKTWAVKLIPFIKDRPSGQSGYFTISSGDERVSAYEPSSTCKMTGISFVYEYLF